MSKIKIHIKGGMIEKIISPFPFPFIVIEEDMVQCGGEIVEIEQDCEIVSNEKYFVLSATSITEMLLNIVNNAMGAAYSGSKYIEGTNPDVYVQTIINQIDQ